MAPRIPRMSGRALGIEHVDVPHRSGETGSPLSTSACSVVAEVNDDQPLTVMGRADRRGARASSIARLRCRGRRCRRRAPGRRWLRSAVLYLRR